MLFRFKAPSHVTLCLFLLSLLPALAACGVLRKRTSVAELAKITNARRPPVIIVPGILGSRLIDRNTGRLSWLKAGHVFGMEPAPDIGFKITKEVARDPRRASDDNDSVGIVDTIPVVPFLYEASVYKPMVDVFERAGYIVGDCDFPRAGEDAFFFHYDFRRDAVETARLLARAVERVRDTREDPTERVNIVAHSFGGLITRYYLMYGGRDALNDEQPMANWSGAENVDAAVFLGTPHHGSIALFEFLLKGYGLYYKGQLLGTDEIRSMPSAYQLLPCPSSDCFLDFTKKDRELPPYRENDELLNIYDPKSWMRYGWLPPVWQSGVRREFFENALARSYSWWTALEQSTTPPKHLRTLAVGGTQTPTIARAIISKDDLMGAESLIFTLPFHAANAAEIEMRREIFMPGDMRVTLESALDLPYASRLASTAMHDDVYQDPAVQDNIIIFVLGDAFLPFTDDTNRTRNAQGSR